MTHYIVLYIAMCLQPGDSKTAPIAIKSHNLVTVLYYRGSAIEKKYIFILGGGGDGLNEFFFSRTDNNNY